MAARKLQQEVDKCFKKVSEGVAEFESIYEKIEQCSNAAQKEKLEDNLKREIKKLQRLRDQIKTWATSNDIKDKTPLLDHRKLIETQMEKFKAVEKAMKTKAYSKEGLSAAAKLDPKERAKIETGEFLGNMVEELERQIETMEAEQESIQATMKKGKSQNIKAERIANLERLTERHKFHQNKLELIKRCLENGNVEVDQVKDLEDSIKYYVSNGMDDDYQDDDEMYDELNLDEEEDNYGMNNDNDRVSSQDTQSIQEEITDAEPRSSSIPGKSKPGVTSEPPVAAARRPSTQMKSPLPALATLHTPLSTLSTNGGSSALMKPAAVPTRAPGETLKYASAAAAAAASDKSNMGIAPLPPPPEALPAPVSSASHPPLSGHAGRRSSVTASPTTIHSQTASVNQTPVVKSSVPTTDTPSSAQTKSPALSQSSAVPSGGSAEKVENTRPNPSRGSSGKTPVVSDTAEGKKAVPSQSNGVQNGVRNNVTENTESVYHLPSGFQDMLQSFEVIQKSAPDALSTASQRMLASSHASGLSMLDVSPARPTFKPEKPIHVPSYYPQEVHSLLEDPRLYSRIDHDTLFYIFYYKQSTYQQYLAARSLKEQSWRFHKQYQTWFQRHEEPKTITEEFEQGTYRFFDYESTWMNRRKADFKFIYKFLEDDV